MKSEEKIIELLAQYLKKTDQLFDRMDNTDRSVEIMSRALVEHSLKFNSVNQEIKSINQEIKTLNQEIKDLNQDVKSVNQEIKFMREEQRVMLGELLSISKRVSSIEERG